MLESLEEVYTDLDGKVYRLTYNGHGELIAVKHLY